MTVKVSIIVPVYNPGKFIYQCIDSLLNQTLKECEFIFVNDGSTDNSLSILKSYQEKDTRIKIIDQTNSGSSIAKNNGIKVATGEYIGFSDSDDYFEIDALETLYNYSKNNNLEIITSNYFLGRDKKEIVMRFNFPYNQVLDNSYIKNNVIYNLLEFEDLFSVWNKFYNRDFIIKNKILFPSNRESEEDAMFNLAAFNVCNKTFFANYTSYHFREMIVSESRNFLNRNYYKDAFKKYNFDYKTYFNLDISDEKHKEIKIRRIVNRFIYLTFATSIATNKLLISKKYSFIKSNVLSKDFHEIVNNNYLLLKKNKGIYEKLFLFVVKKKYKILLFTIVTTTVLLYKSKFSELLRKLNNMFK